MHKDMKAPIYIYYQLDNYYQNHRRSDCQLLDGLDYKDTSSCRPEENSNGRPIVPCGSVAWIKGIGVNRKNIAWKSDREHKFGKDVYPFNFQNGTLISGGTLNPTVPLSDQEDLIVWMRTAALPSFRKLYGRIEQDLDADDLIIVCLVNNYNTYSFGGKKKLVLSTSSWLGGKERLPLFAIPGYHMGRDTHLKSLMGTQPTYFGTGRAMLAKMVDWCICKKEVITSWTSYDQLQHFPNNISG
ncbi:hypothetical protein MKX01_017020 [Papaver californicum]|nr:hypothetical protein MKX01_017020 [Papaver californicum]